MNRFDERAYNIWLSDLIRKQKESSPYFTDEHSGRREIDVTIVAEEIARKHPEVLERLLSFAVDAKNRNISQKDILEYLGTQEKGASVIWHDKHGNEILFVNTGKSEKIGKKKIIILNEAFSNSDIETLKKNLLKEILKNDVAKIYKEIAPKENERIRREEKSSWQKRIRAADKDTVSAAIGFERDFKRRIKSQGFGASSAKTFSKMVNDMSGSQAKSLLKTLTALGIKPGEDFKNLLSRWRTEALNEKTAEAKKPQRNFTWSQSQEMEIGM